MNDFVAHGADNVTFQGVALLIKMWGLDWLLDIFASYNAQLQFQSLVLPPNTTVHHSLGHFFGSFSNSWN
jgi:hypothetical protein